MVEARVDQGGIEALVSIPPEVRVDQGGIEVLLATGVPVRIDQGGVEALVAITPIVPVVQAGIEVLAYGSPCTTQRCQVWTITRTDGQVFRFTSLDRDLEYPPGSGIEYRSCDSLVPSASESVSEVDAAGNMDLSGALGPNGIAKEALYAGLFDGAVAEAWLVPWAGTGVPKLLLRGTFGPVEKSDTGFRAEILGDGARLQQTPLIKFIQPQCHWQFGDRFCQVDLAPLTVTGTVDSGAGLREFTDAARAETPGYFSRGRIVFTSGTNAGISAEIKEHAAGGVFTLWTKAAFPIAAGDQYSMTPGCTNLKTASGGTNGCTAWANLRRYGGFDKVPGSDKRNAAANVRT